MIVQREARAGDHRTIRAEYLARPGKFMDITYRSERAVVAEGDFISVRGKQVSVLDIETMAEMRFTIGGKVESVPPRSSAVSVEQQPPLVVVRPPKRPPLERSAKKVRPKKHTEEERRLAEAEHFPRDTLQGLRERFRPIVSAYARAGIRKPGEVCDRLNIEGHPAPRAPFWTPLLVEILLAQLFEAPRQSTGSAVHRVNGRNGQRTGKGRAS